MVESVFIDKTLIFKSLCEQVMDGPNHHIWLRSMVFGIIWVLDPWTLSKIHLIYELKVQDCEFFVIHVIG